MNNTQSVAQSRKGEQILNTRAIDRKHVGEKLRALRGEKTIANVADELKISPSAITMYENGCRIPRDDLKLRISDYYGVDVQELFFNAKQHK